MDAPKEVQTPGEFKCELCALSALYTYYGQTPPNSHSIYTLKSLKLFFYMLLEEAYVRKDPFTPDKDKFLFVGFHCSLCSRAVCVVMVFSLLFIFSFYSKRFCLPCVKENLKAFPLEIQEDMDKRKPQQK
ncbi:CDPF1 protein, partial [Daphoenositta chrysoptera]|nr:CDPF1 protein [Daphoenositta chrysoptera]